jgi:hypothetical protein
MPRHPELRAMMIALKYGKQINKSPENLDKVFSALVGCSSVCIGVTCGYLYAICDASIRELVDRKAKEYLGKEDSMFVSIMEAVMGEGFAAGRESGKAEGKEEGKVEGKVEGKAEGKVEGFREGALSGKVDSLLVLMSEVFGKVPAKVKRRIRTASEAQLETWTRRILKAKSIEELFAEPSP